MVETPSVKPIGPDYIIEFERLTLRFSRIYEARDELTAMVEISVRDLPGMPDGGIWESKLILTGSNSKRDAAKAVGERTGIEGKDIPEWADWKGMIELACRLVRQHHEEGDPAINLALQNNPEVHPMLFDPFLRVGEHAMIYGKGGSAKSLLCLIIAACLSHASAYIGGSVYPKPLRVLYLDYEDTWETHFERLKLLMEGLGMGVMPEIWHKAGTAPFPVMATNLSRFIAEEGIDFLIVDSAGVACGADPETSAAATAFYRALLTCGVGQSLTIAHHNRVDETHPFGSVYWWNTMRNIWLAKAQQELTGELHLGLFHRKHNNQKEQPPQGLRIHFLEDAITVERESVRRVEAFRDQIAVRDRIETALEDALRATGQGLTVQELHEATNATASTVRTTLSRMSGRVLRVDDRWVLRVSA